MTIGFCCCQSLSSSSSGSGSVFIPAYSCFGHLIPGTLTMTIGAWSFGGAGCCLGGLVSGGPTTITLKRCTDTSLGYDGTWFSDPVEFGPCLNSSGVSILHPYWYYFRFLCGGWTQCFACPKPAVFNDFCHGSISGYTCGGSSGYTVVSYSPFYATGGTFGGGLVEFHG